ncbi:hypothetical protein KIPE111705_13380 [Kibdelosporangium persicum]|uniref:Butirosin biosynthesis protein H N-terminal domain-containing protein n=1 Tax=Kibdelosporangium persicum TaxID=2698649 RepID=A0ABX2F778_9PSEU|nr:hypothetical protein [Kibdelosporangium persicum]NRN67204.1 hypothetical protein [Kibdelosporangium persicum]
MTPSAELSCYTTNLAEYLSREVADLQWHIASAIRLGVRAAPGSRLVFSQHTRMDQDREDQELAYRASASWDVARELVAGELARSGQVLVVTDAAHLPWSPYPEDQHGPHWILVRARRNDTWLVVDRFSTMTMHGRQYPFEGWLTDAQLRRAMKPMPGLPVAVRNRDAHALGTRVPLPPDTSYRWLAKVPASAPSTEDWSVDALPTLRLLADRLTVDDEAVVDAVDDLWAAGVHQRFRLTAFTERGLTSVSLVEPVLAAWSKLARSLRFAAKSAQRGKPRPDLVVPAFDRLITATEKLCADLAAEV